MKNSQWTLDSPFFVHFKQHLCPFCKSEMIVKRVKRVVNYKSHEAQEFDFSFAGGDGAMFGDVEFSFEAFFCPACEKAISIKEMKAYERRAKKKK